MRKLEGHEKFKFRMYMTLEDEICAILRKQYLCCCDDTGSPASVRVGIPAELYPRHKYTAGRNYRKDFCIAVKKLCRIGRA